MAAFFSIGDELINFSQIGEIEKFPDELRILYTCQGGRKIDIKYSSQEEYDNAVAEIIEAGEGGGSGGDAPKFTGRAAGSVGGIKEGDFFISVGMQTMWTKLLSESGPQGSLTEDLVVSNPVGSATLNKKYGVGTDFETLIRDMLVKQEAPAVSVSITPSKVLYDKVVDKLEQLTMKITTVRKTYDIDNVKIYVDDNLVKTVDEDVGEGGIINYIYTYPEPINVNTTIKVVVTDVKDLYSTSTILIKFVGKTYYGYVESTVGEPTASQVKALQNNTLKDTKGFVYKNISFDYNKIVYAYPKEFGDLSMISDEIHHYEYTNSFTKTTVKIDDINYLVYTQTDASASAGLELTFK